VGREPSTNSTGVVEGSLDTLAVKASSWSRTPKTSISKDHAFQPYRRGRCPAACRCVPGRFRGTTRKVHCSASSRLPPRSPDGWNRSWAWQDLAQHDHPTPLSNSRQSLRADGATISSTHFLGLPKGAHRKSMWHAGSSKLVRVGFQIVDGETVKIDLVQ